MMASPGAHKANRCSLTPTTIPNPPLTRSSKLRKACRRQPNNCSHQPTPPPGGGGALRMNMHRDFRSKAIFRPLPALSLACLAVLLAFPFDLAAADAIPAPGSKLAPATNDLVLTAADFTVEKIGTNIPASAIGEPVGGVTLSPPRWVEATANSVAYATVDGSI